MKEETATARLSFALRKKLIAIEALYEIAFDCKARASIAEVSNGVAHRHRVIVKLEDSQKGDRTLVLESDLTAKNQAIDTVTAPLIDEMLKQAIESASLNVGVFDGSGNVVCLAERALSRRSNELAIALALPISNEESSESTEGGVSP